MADRLRLRNWRVRSRLVALVIVPTVAAALLGGVQVVASVSAAADYQRVNDLARLSDEVGALVHELAGERDLTAWFIARGRPSQAADEVREQMDAVDAASRRVRDNGALLGREVSGRTGEEIGAALTRLGDLASLRRQALEERLLPDAALDAYTLVIGDLVSLHDELGKGTDDDLLFGQALTLDALARAKESLSLQRGLLSVVLVAGRFEQEQMERFLGAISTEQEERRAFAAEAGPEDRRFFDENVNGHQADRAEFLRELVLLRASSGAPLRGLDLAKKDDARQWFEAVSVTIDRMRTVEQRHARQIVTHSEELRAAEQSRALLVAGAVGALLLIVLLITTGVARSLVRPLRTLRTEALEVAGTRLPAYVQRVRESRDGEIPVEVPPIGVTSRDEIGEVARAFDEVHREAVRLAGDEAKLRTTVNAMFVNLSRRSQTLVERQLTLVERLERGERDDERLADLFKLDHLATRMRRNSENLLVLAGQEVARRWRKPVEIMDVVRAALSEVEDYDRVVTRVQSEAAVVGTAVSDVVHLLAELVENAITFSPSETKVVISGSRIDGGGMMILVSDQGIGMTAQDLAEANARLAAPQVADASVARRMGLFVVSRLALRHGIRVQLRPQGAAGAGLTAMVLLPDALLAPLPGAVPSMQAPSLPSPPPMASVPPMPSVPSFQGEGHTGPGSSSLPPPRSPASLSMDLSSFDKPLVGPLSAPVSAAPPPTAPVPTGLSGDDRFPEQPDPFDRFMLESRDTSTPSGRFMTESRDTSALSDRFMTESSELWASSGRFPADDRAETGPLPTMRTSALDSQDEYLPIFAEVESGWFRSLDRASMTSANTAAPSAEAAETETAAPAESPAPAGSSIPAEPPVPAADSWSSPGDSGWKTARAAAEPSVGGVTSSGLPKRTPKANLVPGSVSAADRPGPRPQAQEGRAAPRAPISAERMRTRMSSFQQGVRRARNELPKQES
ncbi:sensor histidine kinase [Planobispora rosea]|uniref:sensor histidine kinase n=1 Tax=Planobispora rosea TaxID=35762 RepID=UPI00083A0FAC|nr:nitrate- and nitrite sensing domain-containing protein [Planobispora rosea]